MRSIGWTVVRRTKRTLAVFFWFRSQLLLLRIVLNRTCFRGDLATSRTAFLLAHMRSGSTMLTHVLNSHPEMCGYLEAHLSYRTPNDIRWLWAHLRVMQSRTFDPAKQYAVDKLVNVGTPVAPSVATAPGVKILLLVRKPAESLSSHMNSFADSLAGAERHYVDRLSQLREMVLSIPERSAAALRYEDVIARTDEVLARMTEFFALSTPLSPEYRIEAMTGKKWYGDTNVEIRSGKIQDVREKPYPVPAEVLERCQRAYDETWATLSARCIVL